MVYNSTMFNLQHILYMVISGMLTVILLVLAAKYAKTQKTKEDILKFFAIITVVIHYSSLWVDFFASGGTATIENNQILPVYPCNVVMWMLLIAAMMKNKNRMLFHLLGEFCFYGGVICGVVGIALNANFGANPTLADYDILKGMLSHSTMLLGCLYMRVGGFVRVRMFNVVSVTAGLACFVLCGVLVNGLYEHFGMVPPDGMFLRSNPYLKISPIWLGLGVVVLMFVILSIREQSLPEEERWYAKLKVRN